MFNARILGWPGFIACWLLLAGSTHADFIVDAFQAATNLTITSGSSGNLITAANTLDNSREYNLEAAFSISSTTLTIGAGQLTHTVQLNGGSGPLAKMALGYIDSSPNYDLTEYQNIKLANVTTNAAWNLNVTLQGTNLPGGTVFSNPIAANTNGDVLIPLASFSSLSSLGLLNKITFAFSNTTGGTLGMGPISVTAVPEPSTSVMLTLTVVGSWYWRSRSRFRRTKD